MTALAPNTWYHDHISDIRPLKKSNIRPQKKSNIRYHAFAKKQIIIRLKKSDIRSQKNQLSDITPAKKSNIRYQYPRSKKNQNKEMEDIILDIDSHCPYLLSGETTFRLTSCSNSLSTIWRNHLPFNQQVKGHFSIFCKQIFF